MRKLLEMVPMATRLRQAWKGGALAVSIPVRWVRLPQIRAGERVCVFVILARCSRILPHSIDLARAWHAAGFAVIATVVASRDEDIDVSALSFADGIMLRDNVGYDFGAWSATIVRLQSQLRDASVLAVANDSVLGPSACFGATIDRALSIDADVIGLVESLEGKRHLQSFVLLFRANALRSAAFWRFWRHVRSGDRHFVIRHYEMETVDWFEKAGLKVASLISKDPGDLSNATLVAWEDLLARGFPFIKIQLLRDNPFDADLTNWSERVAAHGFNMARLQHQIDLLASSSGNPWAISQDIGQAGAIS
jgi:hypothetical protein